MQDVHDVEHLVIVRKRTEMPHFPVVGCTPLDWHSVGDAVDHIVVEKIVILVCMVHGNSNSFTFSNSANMRRL